MVEPLEEKVAAFIHAHAMFDAGSRVLLGVSGGADSIALLHVLHTLARRGLLAAHLFCLHIDHQLRGSDSRDDAAFVAEQASQLGIPCDTKSIDVKAYAGDHGLSLETAGRQIRLDSFAEAAQTLGCAWVATGHQKNDNAETVLQRLRRGTGYRGLRGIQPVRPLREGILLARPLLSSTRDEIVTYLRRRGLTWREDRSNVDCVYTRNLVRHRLLPALQEEAQGCLIEELSELAASAEGLYQKIRRDAEEASRRGVESRSHAAAVDVGTLLALPQPVAVELIRMQLVQLGCGERDLTDRHYASVLRLAHSQSSRGEVTLPGGYAARRDHHQLIFVGADLCVCPPTPGCVTLSIPGETTFAEHTIRAEVIEPEPGQPFKIPADKTDFVEYLDLDRIAQPLVVRSRRPGDSFWPLGLRGPKKVGKFLTTARVPPRQREHIFLFDDGWTIVWVCPIRLSEQAKVTAQTRRVLKLSVR